MFYTPPLQVNPQQGQADTIQSQIQTMNLQDSFDPNLNFTEQAFLQVHFSQ